LPALSDERHAPASQLGGLLGVGTPGHANEIMAAEREGESAVCQRVKYPLRPKGDARRGLSV
jgi:hypothetical protein